MPHWRDAIDNLDRAIASYGEDAPEPLSPLRVTGGLDLSTTQRLAEQVAAQVEESERVAEERDAAEVARQENMLSALAAVKDVLVEQERNAAQREAEALDVAYKSMVWARIAGVAGILAIVVTVAMGLLFTGS